ncbi:MAG: BACON domain-containing protein [Bryobacteraceae bacterium]
MCLLNSIRTFATAFAAVALMAPQSTRASVLASDSFQVPPYSVASLAGQAVGGSGFTGKWTSDPGLTQDLAVKSSGVIGRPAVPSGSGGDYAKFASPIALNAGQFFVSFNMVNLGGSNLSSTRIDLNFGTSAPFVNYRVSVGGNGAAANLNIMVESAVTAGNTAFYLNTSLPSTGSHHLVGVLDAQNQKVALFVDPTSSSYYNSDGTNNATAVAAWIPPATLNLYSYSIIENTGDNVNFSNVVFANDPASVGLSGTAATGSQFTFNGFASMAGLTLVGNAATASTSDGTVLRLTPAAASQSGAAYSTTPVTLGNNAVFNTQFQFRFTNPGGWDPADGITFVITTNTKGLGAGGVGMGYQGVSGSSIAIEFDTYNNTGFGLGNDDGNSSNHVSIDTDGNLTNTDITNVYSNPSCGFPTGNPGQNSYLVPGCMSNGRLWTANIGFDGAKLTVTVTDPAEGGSFTAINGYAINLASILGQNTAYVGFTAGTGAGWENHDIVNWTFSNTVPSGSGGGGGCSYSIAAGLPNPASFSSAAGSGTVVVTSGAACSWTVTSSASWLTTTGSGSGNAVVSYTVAANASTSSRTATLTVGNQTLTVTQAAAGSGSCAYYAEPQSLSIPAGGASGTILVSTQSGCALNASAGVYWIHIPASGASAVSYQVDPNTSSGPRTGAIGIGNSSVQVSQDGVPVCNYAFSPASDSVSAQGGASSTRLTTAIGCAWTATINPAGSWFHLTSPSTGTGGANLPYTADANTTPQTRTATVTANGSTFALTQAGGASASAPVIGQGGIANAASNRPGTVARGSYFTIYGSNLGPAQYQLAPGFPIPDNLAGVVVTVSQGSYSKRAYLNFVYMSQINAILPSDTPLGNVQVTVSYNGTTSAAATVNVVNTAFGTFSTAYGPGPGIVQNYNSATNQPLNTASTPLTPGQIAILWGTGLGPITTGDNTPPPGGNMSVPVQVSVGGIPASIQYAGRAPGFAGVDNIYFNVPANTPTGCSVPVQVTAAGVTANTVRVAINSNGSKCQDPANPFVGTTSSGGTTGTIGLVRVSLSGIVDSSQAGVNSTFDVGLGIFSNTPAGGDLAFSSFMNLPPVGTCVSTNKLLDFGSVIGTSGLSLDNSGSKSLDAGSALTVTGPKGTAQITHFDPNSGTGPYLSLLGGEVPVDGSDSLPPFLEPGSYTVTGPGGKDIGKFTASLNLATPVNWTNQSQITSINRSAGLTLTWSGGDANSSLVILGGSSDQQSKNSGGFFCLAPVSAGTFTVPSNVLMDLPPTGPVTNIQNTIGVIAIAALPLSNPTHFTAPGLTNGLVAQTYLTAVAVPVQ